MATYAELQAQIKKLQEQADALKKAERKAVIAEIKEKIAAYDLTAEQLGLAPSKRAKKESTVMYQKGDLTWSGSSRGRKPAWVNEVIEAGEDIEKYRVN
ncbi:H-NS family nucleoid-associated regulatory protein [Neisseria sp. S1]|uniref:H-NS histone family protein n=1 Tax=Neisseria sp. S1 TaxID=3318354 RepID=UPI003A8A97E1